MKQTVPKVLRRRGMARSRAAGGTVNRKRPEWTRARWDKARAELDGGATCRLVVAAGLGY